jgi:hypothetical protein
MFPRKDLDSELSNRYIDMEMGRKGHIGEGRL